MVTYFFLQNYDHELLIMQHDGLCLHFLIITLFFQQLLLEKFGKKKVIK